MHAFTLMSRGTKHAFTVPCDMHACIVKVSFLSMPNYAWFGAMRSMQSVPHHEKGIFVPQQADETRFGRSKTGLLGVTSGIQLKISLFHEIDLKRRREMCQPLQAGECGIRSDALTEVDGSRVRMEVECTGQGNERCNSREKHRLRRLRHVACGACVWLVKLLVPVDSKKV